MTLPDRLIDVCHPFPLMHTDCSVRPKTLPGKTDRPRLELLGVQLYERLVGCRVLHQLLGTGRSGPD
jgi:hypothetical protein